MASPMNYEILLNLSSMNILSIRQSSFYQLRLTVYQTDSKNNNIFAVPFLILRSEGEPSSKSYKNYDVTNVSEIDHGNNTFLTRKFIVRNIDQKVEINEMCIFKGSLLAAPPHPLREIKIYVELLSYQQNDVEIVEEWRGSTLNYIGSSYCPMYFNSYKFTCNINASIHLIISSLSLQAIPPYTKDQSQAPTPAAHFKKYSRFLQESIEALKGEMKVINPNRAVNGSFEQSYQFSPSTYRYEGLGEGRAGGEMGEEEVKELEGKINSWGMKEGEERMKKALNLLNQAVYQFWREYQLLITKQYSQAYERTLRQKFYQQLASFHWENSILVEESGKPFQDKKEGRLFIYPFEKHETYLKLKKKDLEMVSTLKQSQKIQLFILVHGYQASSFDMEPISNYLRYKFKNVLCLASSVNEGKTEQQIEESAHRLAIEIKNYINSLELKDFEINFVCHSLGGIIGRASLKYLQLHKERFNQFVSLCSPHLGYLYHSSALISTSLWILNKVKKDPSMIELTLSDSEQLHKTYMFEASKGRELGWFRRIWLFGSREDEYVPYWSAILEGKSFIFETEAAKVYHLMLDNLTKDIEQKIIRCEILFNEKGKDISNLIGRTAHIKILNFIPGIELFTAIFTP